jgi:ParB-like chromosome segregation protein Spo0J
MDETYRQDCLTNLLEPSPELLEVQNLMPMDASDRNRLKEDIEQSGIIRDPIKVYKDGRKFMILGGFNRWTIAVELGFETVPVEIYRVTEEVRKELVIKDNLNRRHLTSDQKRNLIAYFLKEDPSRSNREIAKKTGIDHKTVEPVRRQLEAGGEIPHLKTIKGMDGKEYSKKESIPVKPVKEKPKTDKKTGANWWTPEMEEKKKYKESLKLMVTKKIQYQIDVLEDLTKQSKKAKKEKEVNEGRIMAYQIAISNLKELLQNILKEIK